MQSLQNHFLLAMPSLKGPYFERSVTYICEHNDDGAMGLVINLALDLHIAELLEQIDIEPSSPRVNNLAKPVLQGGPVSPDRGFVLHSPMQGFDSSLKLHDDFMVTTSKDVLATLGTKDEPSQYLMALGYAGWSPGQLEQELADNSWLTLPASPDIMFNTPIHKRWEQAATNLGIDIWQLSSEIGHA